MAEVFEGRSQGNVNIGFRGGVVAEVFEGRSQGLLFKASLCVVLHHLSSPYRCINRNHQAIGMLG